MDWLKAVTPYRIEGNKEQSRTEFERDQDRIIFSIAFKKLNDKTQVFPIPENQIVHSRMTHSLETSSVGRSIGQQVAEIISQQQPELLKNNPGFVKEIGEIVKTAALTHDIGNPPFGHSGEDAISHFYDENQSLLMGLTEAQKKDMLEFEGNAQGFRLLSNTDNGLKVTANVLTAFTKYPRESIVNYNDNAGSKRIDQKKYGTFQSEKSIMAKITSHFNLDSLSKDSIATIRHPLAYIVEAADDFCYLIMDLEDSVKLRIVSYDEVKDFFFEIIRNGDVELNECYLNSLTDVEQKIGYLRAKSIQSLIGQSTKYFIENLDNITEGKLITPLSKNIKSGKILKDIQNLSINRIYNYHPVLEIEAAGFEVLSGLLEIITDALLQKENPRRKKIIELLPCNMINTDDTQYEKLLKINDYVSGMTDNYAISFYRKVKGISLPRVY